MTTPLHVRVRGRRKRWVFDAPFRVGRAPQCGLSIDDIYLASEHAEVFDRGGVWMLRDLASPNGLWVDGWRAESIPLANAVAVRFGSGGPIVDFAPEGAVSRLPVWPALALLAVVAGAGLWWSVRSHRSPSDPAAPGWTLEQVIRSLRGPDRKSSLQDAAYENVARQFGEPGFPSGLIRELDGRIARWKASGSLAQALRLARSQGYLNPIASEFRAAGLAPAYTYMALVESGFDIRASGPPTERGVARGMWQFIPATAVRYGLKVEQEDERLQWQRATTAAVRYLRDLHASNAPASGLLVIASYNWGETAVFQRVRKLPGDKRDRTFWQFATAFRGEMPAETYRYVLDVVSAAVIGENPRAFGFSFDNPLESLSQPDERR